MRHLAEVADDGQLEGLFPLLAGREADLHVGLLPGRRGFHNPGRVDKALA